MKKNYFTTLNKDEKSNLREFPEVFKFLIADLRNKTQLKTDSYKMLFDAHVVITEHAVIYCTIFR